MFLYEESKQSFNYSSIIDMNLLTIPRTTPLKKQCSYTLTNFSPTGPPLLNREQRTALQNHWRFGRDHGNHC